MLTRRKAMSLLLASMAATSGFSQFGLAQTREGPQNVEELPADISALVETVFRAFNSKDFNLLKSVYAGNLVIIDGFAPYRWMGPHALDEWWADTERWAKDGGVASEHLSYEGILASGVAGARAYASTSATLTIKLNKGEPIIRRGTLIFTFAKLGEMWKAEGHAWGRLS
jgi:ketosteroid isomerase-like protein